ncbi:MAG: MATE family efflux transporter [Victivallales bacterium]
MTQDMTTGSPLKVIIRFSLPVFIGCLFQQFYSMADTIIVGRTVSVQALAAVGVTGGVSFLVLGFFFGLTGGFAVVTGQCFGAKDYDGVRRSVAVSTVLCIVISILVTALCVLTARPLFVAMNTPADIFDDTLTYMLVIYYGIWASVFYNMISSIIRALGDSITPLIFLGDRFASEYRSGLSFHPEFWHGSCRSRVGYCAFAGDFRLSLPLVCCAQVPILKLKRSDWKWNSAFAWEHLRVGLPMAFQFSITAIGCIILQAVLNLFGSTVVAGFTAGSRPICLQFRQSRRSA